MINYNELFEKSKELANRSGLTQLELYQRFYYLLIQIVVLLKDRHYNHQLQI